MVHEVNKLANPGEEGEFGVGGGAAFAVKVVEKLSVIHYVTDWFCKICM